MSRIDSSPNPFTIDDVRKEMRYLIDPVQTEIRNLTANLSSLQSAQTSTLSFAEIVNILDNSHPEWSDMAYTTLGITPATAGDTNYEAHNWFRVLSTELILTNVAATSVKSVGHSLYAANEGTNADIPIWERDKGEIQMGGLANKWDLIYKLPTNLIYPGMYFYLQMELMLNSNAPIPSGVQIFGEFWDSTATQRKVIEGGNFTITGEIFGVQSGATNVQYQVKAKTDGGDEAVSNILVFTNAPAVFTQDNHPRISFRGAPGFIEFEIYRKTGAVYVLQYVVRNAIESTYFDVGLPPVRTVAGFPAVSASPPRAFAQSTIFMPGAFEGMRFERHDLTIIVPTTYNRTLTDPDSQWLRLGLSNLTDEARQIVIRRIGLSQGSGMWARSANDSRTGVHSSPTSRPTSSGSGGSGGGSGDPPVGGGGGGGGGFGGGCVVVSESVINVAKDEEIVKIPLKELSTSDYTDNGGAIFGKVIGIKAGHASQIFRVKTANGKSVACNFDHPFITDGKDITGTPAVKLKKLFDEGKRPHVLTEVEEEFYVVAEKSEIIAMTVEYGSFEVGIPQQEGSHICIINGFFMHNIKDILL